MPGGGEDLGHEDLGYEDLGQCCGCQKAGPDVRNIMMLHFRAPVPGTGWGCVACHQPCDGAVAVLCDDCLNAKAEILDVCHGYAGENRRVSRSSLTEPFDHDMRLHQQEICETNVRSSSQ